MKLLLAQGSYHDLMLRMIGTFMLALAVIVLQIIRHRVMVLYPTTLVVRAGLLVGLAVFFALYQDPFLIVLMAIVGLGFLLTLGSYLGERKT